MNDSDAHLVDVITKTRLVPGDIVILHTDERASPGRLRELYEALRKAAPAWAAADGLVLALRAEDDLEVLDSEHVRPIYERLRRRFEATP